MNGTATALRTAKQQYMHRGNEKNFYYIIQKQRQPVWKALRERQSKQMFGADECMKIPADNSN